MEEDRGQRTKTRYEGGETETMMEGRRTDGRTWRLETNMGMRGKEDF